MRVVSGSARGAVLVAPEGMQTRPTADRAKEALFSMLMEDVAGCRFLDLFSGSGAIGIEALSRGAAFACFVDSAAEAVAVTRQNLAKTKLAERAEVIREDVVSAVARLAGRGDAFGIVFLDPPYETGLAKRAAEAVLSAGLVRTGGLLVVEQGANEALLAFENAALWKQKRYGAAAISIYEVAK